MIKNGFNYIDLKIDNFGIKYINNFYNYLDFSNLNNINLYFLDFESGYTKIIESNDININSYVNFIDKNQYPYRCFYVKNINDDNTCNLITYKEDYNNQLILNSVEKNKLKLVFSNEYNHEKFVKCSSLISHISNYGFLGQFNINQIFDLQHRIHKYNFDKLNNFFIYYNFIILDKSDVFHYIKIKKNNDEKIFYIQICVSYIRLVLFDENKYHPSMPEYNHSLPKIDELFEIKGLFEEYNYKELINKIKYIYGI